MENAQHEIGREYYTFLEPETSRFRLILIIASLRVLFHHISTGSEMNQYINLVYRPQFELDTIISKCFQQ